MLGLFKKKSNNSIKECINLANSANIDVVMEEGNYAGFLIFLNENTSNLANYFSKQEALSEFVNIIEKRIKNLDFNDPSSDIEMVSEMREMTGWQPNMNVVRAVMAHGNKPVFSWNP